MIHFSNTKRVQSDVILQKKDFYPKIVNTNERQMKMVEKEKKITKKMCVSQRRIATKANLIIDPSFLSKKKKEGN